MNLSGPGFLTVPYTPFNFPRRLPTPLKKLAIEENMNFNKIKDNTVTSMQTSY